MIFVNIDYLACVSDKQRRAHFEPALHYSDNQFYFNRHEFTVPKYKIQQCLVALDFDAGLHRYSQMRENSQMPLYRYITVTLRT